MTRPTLARLLALVAAATTAIAACGGSAATGAPSDAAATSAPATQGAASQAPLGSGGPGFSFSLPSEDKDLEAIIPDEIGGEAVVKSSMGGGSMPSEDMTAMLQKLGKTPADLSAAFGGNSKASLVAVRVKGTDANALFEAFKEGAAAGEVGEVTDVTIAGKQAKRVVSGDGATTSYLYVRGDTLITVGTMAWDIDQQVLDEIFSKLP